MSAPDLSKLRKGDTVTVRIKYAGLAHNGAFVKSENSETSVYVPDADILSVETRPISVGDTVVPARDGIDSTRKATVVALDGSVAWIKFNNDFTRETRLLSELVRV